VQVTVDDAQDLLAAASLFQYAEVVNTCCRFLLTHLHPSNCLGVEAFGHHHMCSQLAAEARRFTLENFEAVATESDEFLELSVQRLESYISSDEIEVRMEEVVFEAVVRWVGVNVDNRQSAACSLLRHVRFSSIASDYIQSTVLPHQLIHNCSQCLALVSNTTQTVCPRPSTIAKEVMVVVGGRGSSGDILTSMEAYSPLKRCWKPLPDIPVSVQYCSVTAVDNDIFVSGGVVDGKTVATVWTFVSATQHWMLVPAMMQPRAHHSSAALGRRLYVVGGTRDASASAAAECVVGSIECLDVGDGAQLWRVVAMVPCPRLGSHTVAYGNRWLVEVGGLQAGTGVVSTVELYACHGDAGQLVYSGEQFVLPEPICRARVAATADVLYIVWTDSRRVISLNVERRIFRRLSDLRRAHVCGGTTVLDGHVYITGGTDGGGDSERVNSTVEVYDAETDKWSDVTPMSQARSGHGCVTIHMR